MPPFTRVSQYFLPKPVYLLGAFNLNIFPPNRANNMKRILLFLLLASVSSVSFRSTHRWRLPERPGHFSLSLGAKYIGNFRNGEVHGVGVCYYTDNSKFSGEWKNRYPDGKGTKTYADGTKRTGQWKKGKPVDEQGKILEEYIAAKKEEQQDDGTNIQSGCLSGDCKNGSGVFAYPDGSKYEGQFKNNKFDGSGTFYFANSDKYVGQFKENFPHGAGARYHPDGTVENGEWREGEFIGSSRLKAARWVVFRATVRTAKARIFLRKALQNMWAISKTLNRTDLASVPTPTATATGANGPMALLWVKEPCTCATEPR